MKLAASVAPSGLAAATDGASDAAAGSADAAAVGSAHARILVLKLSALGNLVLSLSAFAAIRRHHPAAEITLLTTAPYAEWMAGSPYFDRVQVDARPAWWNVLGWCRLRRMLAGGGFDRVYDLQTSGRSSRYLRLFPRHARPEWSGIAFGCSHPDRDPNRDHIHDIDRLHGQLRQAGIDDISQADLSWSHGDLHRFALPPRIALLVPGSSAHRPDKRWPVAHYRELAAALSAQGLTPVVIGAAGERNLAEVICRGSAAIDLTGRTGFGELAELGRRAELAVGNDTGPMHLLAVVGCPSLVLFSSASEPARCVPRGRWVRALQRPNLADLPPSAVLDALPSAVPASAMAADDAVPAAMAADDAAPVAMAADVAAPVAMAADVAAPAAMAADDAAPAAMAVVATPPATTPPAAVRPSSVPTAPPAPPPAGDAG